MQRTGVVSATTGFPGGVCLSYTLESSPASVHPTAVFADNEIRVRLPEDDVRQWATTEQVSISGEQLLDNGQQLVILVEKDFACLAPREGEDESDMFPHPEESGAGC